MSERDKSIDQAGGIMLLMVMLGHVLDWCDLSDTIFWNTLQLFLFFYMPWFFYKGGMFYKEKDIKKQVVDDFYKLVVPYLLFFICSTVVDGVIMFQNGGSIKSLIHVIVWSFFVSGTAPGNSALWFFVAYFVVKTCYAILHNSMKLSDIWIIIGGIVILLIVNLLKNIFGDLFVLKYPENLWSSLIGLVYFCAGHYLKEKQFLYNYLEFV